MNPFDYYLDVFKNKYADFSGRARRSEYWYFFLFNMIALVVAMMVDGMLGSMGIFYAIYALASFIPSIAVSIRRLHDTNRSGWFLLLSFIPLVGIILFFFFVQDSTPGSNEYGPNPKDPDYLEDDIVDHLID